MTLAPVAPSLLACSGSAWKPIFSNVAKVFFPISWETNFIGKMFPTTSLKSPPSPPIISTLMQFLPFSIGASFPPLPFAAQIYGKNSTLSSRGIEARVRYQSCKRIKFWIFIYFSRKKCRGSWASGKPSYSNSELFVKRAVRLYEIRKKEREKLSICLGGSPGLVVMGDNTYSEGCGFESQHNILEGNYSNLPICCKNCYVCLKRWK